MPIREITEKTLEQVCNACDEKISLPIDSLSVGVKPGEDYVDDSIIRLPPCPACGSVEFLVRSSEDGPNFVTPGSYGHLHRLLVDLLHDRLVSIGQVTEGIDAYKVKTRPPEPEVVSRWFKDGLTLERLKKADKI